MGIAGIFTLLYFDLPYLPPTALKFLAAPIPIPIQNDVHALTI